MANIKSANVYKCATPGCNRKVGVVKHVLHRYCAKCRRKMGMYKKKQAEVV